MDETDRKLLRVFQAEPDLSMQDLALRIGLSHTPCWRRVKKLERDGVIAGRALVLNPEALSLSIVVFAHVKVRQHDEETLEAFERSARERREIVECYSMTGEADFLLRIVTASVAEYETFLKRTLLHLPGVASINSSFALKCVKQTTMLPI